MGIGIVSFTEEVEEETNPDPYYEYRTNTDVITLITLTNTGSDDVTPDKGCEVEFEILGRTYSKPFICDFGFTTYNCILEPESSSVITNWHFKENMNWYYGNPVHFTLWCITNYLEDAKMKCILDIFKNVLMSFLLF